METINGAPVIDVFLPTYRMEPAEEEKFYPSRAKIIAEKVAATELADIEFNDEDAKTSSMIISDEVRI